jgi:hypothetical protein
VGSMPTSVATPAIAIIADTEEICAALAATR